MVATNIKPIEEKFECPVCWKIWGDMRAKRKKIEVCTECMKTADEITRDEAVNDILKTKEND